MLFKMQKSFFFNQKCTIQKIRLNQTKIYSGQVI